MASAVVLPVTFEVRLSFPRPRFRRSGSGKSLARLAQWHLDRLSENPRLLGWEGVKELRTTPRRVTVTVLATFDKPPRNGTCGYMQAAVDFANQVTCMYLRLCYFDLPARGTGPDTAVLPAPVRMTITQVS